MTTVILSHKQIYLLPFALLILSAMLPPIKCLFVCGLTVLPAQPTWPARAAKARGGGFKGVYVYSRHTLSLLPLEC